MKRTNIILSCLLTLFIILKAPEYIAPHLRSERFLQTPANDISYPSQAFAISTLFDIYYEFQPPANITMLIKFNVPGQYFSIGLGDSMFGSDMWVFELEGSKIKATDTYGVGNTYPALDTDMGGKNSLEILGYEVTPAYSLVKFTRELNTHDRYDMVIKNGSNPIIWATAPSSPMMSYHGPARGALTANFKLVPQDPANLQSGGSASAGQPVVYGAGADVQESYDMTIQVHAIVNAIAWLIMTDIGILVMRLLKGRKLSVGRLVVPVQLIHAGIMLTACIMSVVTAATALQEFLKTNPSGKKTGIKNQDIHYINGLAILGLITVALLTGLLSLVLLSIRKVKVDAAWTIRIKNLHILFGWLLYLDTKVNMITGALLYQESKWETPIYVYIGAVIALHLIVQFYISWESIFANKRSSNVEKQRNLHLSRRQARLVAAVNKGKPHEELLREFPDIYWVILGNKIYDLTYWIHPGGNNIIKAVTGREIGRFFYGNHALEDRNLKPHVHSAIALSQLKSMEIGEITYCESVLLDNKGEKQVTTKSLNKDTWKIVSMKPVTETVTMVSFENENYKVKNYGESLSWLGRHFHVSFNNERSGVRLYTTAMALSDANIELRHMIFKYFDDILSLEDSVKQEEEVSFEEKNFDFFTEPQTSLPLFIKNYAQFPQGLSSKIHQVHLDDPKHNNFWVEGPLGRGLEMSPESLKGHMVIICAGTGLLPMIDFLSVLLWKNMYEILKEKVGVEKAEKINVLGLPFHNWMNGLDVTFMGSFVDEREVLGLDIIKKLAEISKRYGKNNFRAFMKGYGDENIERITERFSRDLYSKNIDVSKEERYLICGPPTFNKQAVRNLLKLGVMKERIMLV